MCEVDWSKVAEISKSMLTPMIGIVTVYIAYQQWRTNKHKLELDKYDRRIKVYEEVIHFIRVIRSAGKVTDELLLNYENAISQAHFLFDQYILAYLEEVYDHSRKLEYWDILYETTSKGYEADGHNHADVCNGSHEEKIWFIKQLDIAKQKFKPCLYIGG